MKSKKLGGAVKFLLALAGLFVIACWVIPAVNRSAPFREVTDFSREKDFNTGGLFYTDVEETGQADATLRDRKRF
ncbi:hypothetical protein FUAX_05800 [Fulvitalea axinellae]|uniref:Uncharacterized protein n=1 Tax=Fulvitalea axinellae TaxID=1182444 RepID=A0AAU9CJJ4_9BACT|nr:hypothetical protein FUAX_05800 [Fulvitalea axinellae]